MKKEFYFSLDFNGELEDVDFHEGIREESDVIDIMETLKGKGLFVSEHRTQGDVFITSEGNCSVTYNYFASPNDGDFMEMVLETTI
jgi:hypothetical protein